MEKKLISFILPYYNLPVKMLCECIDSILALSLRDEEREIIVVDDGSETSPIEELMQYGQDITYIRQRNMGLSEARNTGIQQARGQYLQFVDTDDLLVEEAYNHCIRLVRTHHPEMVVFDFTRSATSNRPPKDSPILSGSDYMRHHNIRGTAWGYLFKKSILGSLCFTPGIWHEDEEFTPLLLLRAVSVCVTDAQAYFYRLRPDSIITGSSIKKRLKRLNDLEEVICRLNTEADHLPPNDKSSLQRRVAQLTMDYLYNIIQQTQSRHYLERKIERLRRRGLFPLPDKDYTTKYKWFRRMTKSPQGLSLLMRTIPLLSKER